MGALSSQIKDGLDQQPILTAEFRIPGQAVRAKVGATRMNANDFAHVNAKLAARSRRGNAVSFQNDPTDFEGQIYMLIRKVHVMEGEELGDPAFDVTDKASLMQYGVDVIAEWFADLFSGQIEENMDEQIEGAKGN